MFEISKHTAPLAAVCASLWVHLRSRGTQSAGLFSDRSPSNPPSPFWFSESKKEHQIDVPFMMVGEGYV